MFFFVSIFYFSIEPSLACQACMFPVILVVLVSEWKFEIRYVLEDGRVSMRGGGECYGNVIGRRSRNEEMNEMRDRKQGFRFDYDISHNRHQVE